MELNELSLTFKVDPTTSTIVSTSCVCTYSPSRQSFGASVISPPNTIDFGSVFSKFANLDENPVVFATISSLLVMYVLLLLWTRKNDKEDLKRVRVGKC